MGLGLLSFSVASATNVSLTYVVDAYRPIAGETVVTQLAFKSCFGFLLSFYTNPWIAETGYSVAFGTMAGIACGVLILWVPLYIWGRQIRLATLRWSLMTKTIGWNEDREVRKLLNPLREDVWLTLHDRLASDAGKAGSDVVWRSWGDCLLWTVGSRGGGGLSRLSRLTFCCTVNARY